MIYKMKTKWKAIYLDGSSLNQYNEDGSFNKYTDIDRSLMEFFEFYGEKGLILRVHLGDNKRLIYRRRVTQDALRGIIGVVYLVGWQKTIGSENVQSICYIFEDGHIEMAGKWDGDSPFAYAPNLTEGEKNNDTN